jgi:D-arabinose 5-phosphate isomerase GutQ
MEWVASTLHTTSEHGYTQGNAEDVEIIAAMISSDDVMIIALMTGWIFYGAEIW